MFGNFGFSVLKSERKMELKKYWSEYIEKVDDALNRPPLKAGLKINLNPEASEPVTKWQQTRKLRFPSLTHFHMKKLNSIEKLNFRLI